MRVAAIDCGTNSIRLLIADIDGSNFREVIRDMEIVRLGQGVDQTGQFHPDAITRTLAAVDKFAAEIAKRTSGFSGADLANLVNESALLAVRRGSKVIEHIDFENARDRVIMGARRESLVLNADEKKATAYHEGGHAVLASVLPHSDPLHKVTILPRGMALGVTWTLPEERHTYSKEYFEDIICKAMGGRVAEMMVFGNLNSGAANDLEQATGIARRMVREWGMSDKVGPMAWNGQQQVFLGFHKIFHQSD